MNRLTFSSRSLFVAALVAVGASCGEYAEDGASFASPAEGGAVNGSAIGSGRLTAGVWDDNRNFDLFVEHFEEQAGLSGRPPFTLDEHRAAHARFAEPAAPNEMLDVALVVDTTGSMGDEIAYLQTELDAISRTIDERYPDADARWALVVYRDSGDAYVVQSYDFTTGDEMRAVLSRQGPDGGGDYPEASDRALAAMNELSWRHGEDVARMAFWIADAPHHGDRARAQADATRGAAQIDVHVYPVASSGVDELTELSMRSTAQLTGGRYLFLTDDSGIGGTHKEPSIPCYFVTKLDRAMLRMVDIELTGAYREPTSEEVIRVGGDPVEGICTLEEGKTAAIF